MAYISPKCLGIVVGVPLLNFLENISSFSGSGRALLSKMIILTLWRWKRKTALVTLSSNLIWKIKYNVLRWLIIYKYTWSQSPILRCNRTFFDKIHEILKSIINSFLQVNTDWLIPLICLYYLIIYKIQCAKII